MLWGGCAGSLVPAAVPMGRTGGATPAGAGGCDEFCGAGPSYLTGACPT